MNHAQTPSVATPRRWPWLAAGLAVLAALAALPSFVSRVRSGASSPSLMTGMPDASKKVPCVLKATAVWASQVIRGDGGDGIARAIRFHNSGTTHWTDVEITIRGVGLPAIKGQATGPHVLRLNDVGAGELLSKDITDFKKADGSAWIPLAMRPTEIEITAFVNGRTCTFEGSSTNDSGQLFTPRASS